MPRRPIEENSNGNGIEIKNGHDDIWDESPDDIIQPDFKGLNSVVQTFYSRQMGLLAKSGIHDIYERQILKQIMLGRRCKKVVSKRENETLAKNDFEHQIKTSATIKIEVIDDRFFLKTGKNYNCVVPSQNSQGSKKSSFEKQYSIPAKTYPKHWSNFDFADVQGIGSVDSIKSNYSTIFLLNKEGSRLSYYNATNGVNIDNVLLHPQLTFNGISVCTNVIILEGSLSKSPDVYSSYIFMNHPERKLRHHIQIMKTAISANKKPSVTENLFLLPGAKSIDIFDFNKILANAEKFSDKSPCFQARKCDFRCPITHKLTELPEKLVTIKSIGGYLEIADLITPLFITKTSERIFRVSEAKVSGSDLMFNNAVDLELTSNPTTDTNSDNTFSVLEENRKQLIFCGNDSISVFQVAKDPTEGNRLYLKELFGKIYTPPKSSHENNNNMEGVRKSSRAVKRVNYGESSLYQCYRYCYNPYLDQTAIVYFLIDGKCLHIKILIFENYPWSLFAKIQLNPIENKFMKQPELLYDVIFGNTFISVRRKIADEHEMFVVPLLVENYNEA